MSHVIREIAEAETVTTVEGHMRGTAIARLLPSAGVDGHITQARIALEPRKACFCRRGALLARDDRSHKRGSRVADRGVVPTMAAKATSLPEERPRPEDDPSEEARDRTQGRASLPAGLDRVQVAARGSRHTRCTALLHHVDEAALLRAFQRQRRAASAGGRWNDGGEIRTRPGA